jgi:hypothetical protein
MCPKWNRGGEKGNIEGLNVTIEIQKQRTR